jgi:hypothetical protein
MEGFLNHSRCRPKCVAPQYALTTFADAAKPVPEAAETSSGAPS